MKKIQNFSQLDLTEEITLNDGYSVTESGISTVELYLEVSDGKW